MKRFNATCLLTLRCNYSCPYCDQARERPWLQYHEIESEYWIEFFKSLPPSLLHLSGGEPFLYSGFYDILNEMPKMHMFYLATNLSMSLNKFVDIVDPKRVWVIAASLHPSSSNFSLKEYIDKIKYLRQFGYNVFVNYVAYPKQIHLIPIFKQLIESAGAFFNVDPFISKTYNYTQEEENEVKKYLTQRRKIGFRWEEEGTIKYCSAGKDYIFVAPNGEVFRCLSGFFHHNKNKFRIGNIKETVQLNSDYQVCFNACPATCDQNVVTVLDSNMDTLSKPLYINEILLAIGMKLIKQKKLVHIWQKLPQKKLMGLIWKS